MQAYKMKVNVPANHQLALSLPASFHSGPAEMILLAETPKGDRVVRLGGVLAPSQAPAADTDPILEVLQELRQQRQNRFESAQASN